MLKFILAATLLGGTVATTVTDATAGTPAKILRIRRAPQFLSVLDRDGVLSAGWLDVLPALATTCKFRVDNRELNAQLVDLSRETGNLSYTRDLYTTLEELERHRMRNHFVAAWTARFDGRPKEACDTAEALWGETGHQFPGVLKHEVASDGVGGVQPAAPSNSCR